MVEFLSDAWIARLDAAARDAEGLASDPPFSVTTLLEGAGAERGYRVCFGPDGASVTRADHPDHANRPDDDGVVLLTDARTAWELHCGELRAQDAFARGTLKMRGRPEVLATHLDLFRALALALAPVRAETAFRDDR